MLAVLAVAAAVAVGFALTRDVEPREVGSPGRAAAGPTTTPTTAPTSTPSSTPAAPTATPTRSPQQSTPAAPSLPRLAPAAPRELSVAGSFSSGFDDSIEPEGDRFRTRSTAELSRWGSRGLPASPGTDTVYIAGRIAADGDSGFGGLPSVRTGTRIALRTDEGTLTYTVRATQTRDAAGITRSPLFTANVPGRLVLVGVRYAADGTATSTYVVVTAQLTGVRE